MSKQQKATLDSLQEQIKELQDAVYYLLDEIEAQNEPLVFGLVVEPNQTMQ